MSTKIITYLYNGYPIEFDPCQPNVMVNATDIGRVFALEVSDYLRKRDTKRLIKICLKKTEWHILGLGKPEDLYVTHENSGTWMHPFLAFTFAGWLDPAFQMWLFVITEKLRLGDTSEPTQDEIIRPYPALTSPLYPSISPN